MVDLPETTRRQLLLWSLIGIVIALVGGKYLLAGDEPGGVQADVAGAVTVGLQPKEETAIKVHVVGAVVKPGLYDLEPGDRTAEAIGAAGGPAPTADLSRINLAARVADGQQLVVPDINDVNAGIPGEVQPEGGPVNLNSATLDELTELDGVGPKTAQKIIDYREEHGGFSHIEELMDVPGIGPAKFDQVKDRIIV